VKVGFTGHQNIGSEQAVEWVCVALSEHVGKNNATHGYTCLAAGADQLFAEVLRQKEIPFTALIPCDAYETTFDNLADLNNYNGLLSCAVERIQIGSGPPGEIAYYNAGKEIVRRAELVFAVWDGEKAKGLGGTGDIVIFAIDNGKTVIHFNPKTLQVAEIKAGSQRAKEVMDVISK
jgi:hypothetical protein